MMLVPVWLTKKARLFSSGHSSRLWLERKARIHHIGATSHFHTLD